MLNYLGPNIGPNGPIASQLPGATPGTMPGAIPRVPPASAPLPQMPRPAVHSAGGGARVHPQHADIAKAILNHPVMQGLHSMANQPPPPPEYATTTQEDGSILLHLKNADGSVGPVVKVIPPIKKAAAPASA